MAILTDTKARNLKPEDKPLPHGGVTGLALHPSTIKGKGKWVLRYVSPITGKRRNAGLGSYPQPSPHMGESWRGFQGYDRRY
ncbi:Arm DNA-binding domain-containing protein [Aeromonas veronii]|uniref:Arm DNA-binding domain-containing protein n=1 Tax=Aeromonas veronii TaxID=654 RepID=UPI0038D29B78